MAKEIKQTLCRMCDNHCALNVTMENGRPTEVLPYPSHPWNQGRICMKGSGAVDFVNHKDRLTKPLKKVDGKFVEIELSQAYDEIAAKLKELKAEYGPQSVSVWKGEAIGFAQEEEIYRRFIYAFGSPNYFSNDSECFASRYLAYRIGFGCWGPPDYENAKHIVIWGSNPPAAHPNSTQFIMRGRRNGAKITVIDPRMSNMARQADHYISIIPGTDGALAMGLARVLINNNWYDKDFVENHTIGFEEYKERVQKCTPEFVEKESGVPAAMVEKLASMLHAAAPHVSIYAGNGPEHHIGGVQGIRAISMLDALLGSFDRLGGTRWPAS
ncbi:MAG: molybdopterin-dependent oxidoreductase, partial [Clostridiales bacterium]